MIDTAETPAERPKKSKKNWYSGKKKRHTIKTQVVVDAKSRQIICMDFVNGKKHNFKLFKESNIHTKTDTIIYTDTGYQGITKIHTNSIHTKKKGRKKPRTKEEKSFNKAVSGKRVLNEHIIGCIKCFRILSERYRNRCKGFGLRFNLIAAIYNKNLSI